MSIYSNLSVKKNIYLLISYGFLILPWFLLLILYYTIVNDNDKNSSTTSQTTKDILYYGILIVPFALGLLFALLSGVYSWSKVNSWLFYIFLTMSIIGNVISLILAGSLDSLRNF